jgi:hypothetical protein
VLPYSPPDEIAEPTQPAVRGPCQVHVAHAKARQAAKAAGIVVSVKEDDEPYVSDREKKLGAARAYDKARYVPRRRKPKRC